MQNESADFMLKERAEKMCRAGVFIETLRRYQNVLTYFEFHDIRELALSGDTVGAKNRLDDILKQRKMGVV